jgi:amino acid adenylation domain-containing protein
MNTTIIEQPKSMTNSVSVIIPAYNSARFLPEAIESVLRQTYSVFEIVVVDDGSTDETREICDRYPTVKYIYQTNQGIVGARNTGLHNSKGEYLIFFDSDDLLLPNAVEIGVNAFNVHPEVGFVFGNYILQSINPDGSYSTAEIYDNHQEIANYENILAGKLKLQCACVLFRRAAVEAVGGFDQNAKAAEDYNLFLRVAREFPIYFHGQQVFEYRYNGGNISGKPTYIIDTIRCHSLQWDYIQQTGNKDYEVAYESGKQAWIKLFGDRLPYEIMKAVRSGQWVKAVGILRLILNYDPNIKFINREVYTASSEILLSHLRKLPIQPSLAYWQQQLAGVPPLLPLPTDRPRGAEQAFHGTTQSFELSQELTSALNLLSTDTGVNLFTTLLAAFDTLLYRYTGTDDIVVGAPIVSHDDDSEVFVNAVVIRTDLSGNPSFRKLLSRVRKVVLAGKIHQDVPFEILVEQLKLQQDSSYSPLFQVMFAFEENISLQKIELSSLTACPWVLENNEGKFDLTLFLEQTNNGLQGKWVYNTDLFNADTIERMNGHFQTLLEGIIADPERPISELPLLTGKEQQQLLVEWNDTQTENPHAKCIYRLFEEQVERTPDAVAVTFQQQQLTYRELNSRANQLAHYLKTLGIGSDALVGICVERSLEMMVGLWGILKAGGAYVPLDPAYPPERLAYMLSDSQMTVLVTQQDLVSLLPEHQAKIVCLDSDWEAISQENEANPCHAVTLEQLAYIIYTSGSTGKPKGVQIPHGAVANFLKSMQRQPGLTDKDILLAITTISFDIAVLELYLPLMVGARVVLVSREVAVDGIQLLRLLKESHATVMQATPATWQLLLAAGWKDRSHLKVLCGGEALSQGLATQLLARVASVWNMYGPTEATVWATTYEICSKTAHTESQKLAILIGKPIDNTQTYILDRYLQPVPIGVMGELYIGGVCLARGYLNRPDLTNEKFIANPFSNDPSSRLYKTGDVVRYLPTGDIEYISRIDNQVKIRGFRIEIGEIEVLLAKHPDICELAVIVQEDASEDKRLVAYIVPQPDRTPTVNDLREFLSQMLPQYMIPAFFVTLDALPLTPNGKVDRKALPTQSIQRLQLETVETNLQIETEKTFTHKNTFGISLETNLSAPRTPTEEILVGIWSQVLGLEMVSIQDNFFLLGGHSLMAVSLFSQIEQTFGKNLPLATLFKAPTIEQLASFLRQEKPPQELWGSLVPLQTDGSKPPLFCIHGGGFNVLIYRQLAQYLGSDRPVYALQARGLDGDFGSILDRIEDMATDYIQEIKTIQPQGPYLLAGLSNGGNIALEMAQQLQAQGQTVGIVAMFDSYGPEGVKLLPPFPRFLSSLLYALQYSVPRSIARSRHSGQNVIATKLNHAIKQLFLSTDTSKATVQNLDRDSGKNLEHKNTSSSRENPIEQMMNRVSSYVLEHSPLAFYSPSAQLNDSNDRVASTLKKLEASYDKAYKAYAPQPYQGRIVVFQAMESPPGYQLAPQLGWEKIAKDGVEVYKIPGNHTSIMESPILAQKMQACLETATDNNCS